MTMNLFSRTASVAIGAMLAAMPVLAQSTAPAPAPKTTPFGYVLKDGKPVPKGNRVTNPDGSWREEVRVGNCITIKERSAAGEYKEVRRCD